MDLTKLRAMTVVAPIAFIVALEIVSLVVLQPLLGNNAVARLLVVFGILALATVPFSLWVFALIERQQRDLAQSYEEILRRNKELAAVNTAIGSISRALDLSSVLQNITDAARELVQSKYAALGVADESGRIVQFITSGISPQQRAAIGPLPQGHGLLGVLIKHGRPLRIPDIARDPHSHGFPPNHPPMKSLLGVPILFQDRPVGDLYLTDKIDADEFSEEDQDLLMLLASHAAVAIENARLYEEVRAARDRLQLWNEELEVKVVERTRQIERYSKELTTRVLQAQEEERKRIARELHDETAQSLSTLLINLDLLEPSVPTDGNRVPSERRSGFARVRELTKRTLDNVRALSHDLRPTILDDFGLVAALHWFADEFKQTFGMPVDVEIDGEPPGRLAPEVELALFRIAQEALTNTGKYAEASRTRLSLSFPDGTAQLVVEDNGKGFDPEHLAGPTRQGGLGLYGMQERADLLGATFALDSAPGEGTRVTVIAPITAAEHDIAAQGAGGQTGATA
jgi:signal transduction histidine kinase